MIRINLLPHREAARKAKREQFYVLAGLISLLALVVAFAGYSMIEVQMSEQAGKNTFLKQEIVLLDKQLGDIKGLREQTQALLARKQVIENLQRDRGETVQLLAELVRHVPEGVYLKSLKQSGFTISVTGYAQSNARVSTLMRNIESSSRLEKPRLIETKAISLNGRRVNEFAMDFALRRNTEEGGKE